MGKVKTVQCPGCGYPKAEPLLTGVACAFDECKYYIEDCQLDPNYGIVEGEWVEVSEYLDNLPGYIT